MVLPRHISIWLCREMLPAATSSSAIARWHRRDHATALHARRRMIAMLASNTVLAEQVAAIRHRINLACRKLA